MTTRQLDDLHRARPFRAFTICMADGDKVRVEHPEFLARTPSGRIIIVTQPDESFRVIDVMLVTNLAVGNGHTSDAQRAPEDRED